MTSLPTAKQVRYVTNTAGEPTDVIVPLALWQQVISTLQDDASGLAWTDEHEPNARILADLTTSLQQATAGQTYPISQLWDDLSE